MAFTWTNIDSGYANQKIALVKMEEQILLILILLKESRIMKILIIILKKRQKPLMEKEKMSFQLI